MKAARAIVAAGLMLVPDFSPAHAQSSAPREAGNPTFAAKKTPRHAPDRILVRFRGGASAAATGLVHARHGGRPLRSFSLVPGLQLVQVPAEQSLQATLRKYRGDPGVLYAEPDHVHRSMQGTVALPNDPYFPQLWGLANSGQTGGVADADIDALEAWNITTGSKQVFIGVIDTGVDYTHPDLLANIWSNPGDCSANGTDDDGNGYADDCHGIDTFNNDSNPMDDHGHGTHVSGTIGGKGNNGVGVVGVNWQVTLIACKFLAANGSGYDSGAIACLEYFAALRQRGINVVATSNSWGGGGFSQALYDAIAAHIQHDILFVAAAGNDAADLDAAPWAGYPAAFYLPNIIAVAATDASDMPAWFSNQGRHTVHLAAPGVSILSTVPSNDYATVNGTSMATPHVSGVIGLLKAQDQGRDWRALRNLVIGAGDAKASLANTISGRRLNAHAALTCTDRGIFTRLLPVADKVSATQGTRVKLAMMHTLCASPASTTLQATVEPTGETLILKDDGVAPDQAAADGIFSAEWILPAPGAYSLEMPNGESIPVGVPVRYVYSPEAFAYRSIVGSSLELGDNDSVELVPPFPIRFADVPHASVYVSSNGLITSSSYPEPTGLLLPTGSDLQNPDRIPARIVAPFWDDLLPVAGTAQNVFWEVLGTAPNRELVIEWRNLNHHDIAPHEEAAVTFQVVFFEGTQDILFSYKDVDFSGEWPDHNGAGSATIGVQVESGFATQYACCVPSVATAQTIRWSLGVRPPPVIQFVWPPELYAGSSAGGLGCHGHGDGHPIPCFLVFGSYFEPGALLHWNGTPQADTFVDSSNVLSVALTDVWTAGVFSLQVRNPTGEQSNVHDYSVHEGPAPAPRVHAITPAAVPQGSTAVRLKVKGSGFVPTVGSHSTVAFEDCAFYCYSLMTVAFSESELAAVVPDEALVSPGAWRLLVSNPPFVLCCESSNSVDFYVTSPNGPTLTVRADTLLLEGPGGRVTDNLGKLDCAVERVDVPRRCVATYSGGDEVVLTATALPGAKFVGWRGECNGAGTCSITLDGEKSVSATFGGDWMPPWPLFTVNVGRGGTGTGKVTSSPVGINCGATCSASFSSGTTVMLVATPDTGSKFDRWSAGCGGENHCLVTLLDNFSIAAIFERLPRRDDTKPATIGGGGPDPVVRNPDLTSGPSDPAPEWRATEAPPAAAGGMARVVVSESRITEQTVRRGQAAKYTLVAKEAKLACAEGLPEKVSCRFERAGEGEWRLTVTTVAETPPGKYTITINAGADGGSQKVTLVVE